jgi:hypothetical protein
VTTFTTEVRGNQTFIFDAATAGACAQDWQTDFVAKLEALGIKTFNNQIKDFDTDPSAFLLQEQDITKKASSLFGVLLPNYPSVASATMLSSYLDHFGSMAVLVIPKYEPDLSMYEGEVLKQEQMVAKDVNRMRSYLKDQAINSGAKVYDTIDEAIPAFILIQSKWANTVGSFGACGNTTWRKSILAPFLEGANLGHYNPQAEPGTWAEWMIEEEEIAKLSCNIILLNLNVVPDDHSTTALVSQIESIRFAQMSNRNVIIIYDPAKDIVASMLIPNIVEREAFLFSRQTMKNIIKNSTNPYLYVVDTFQDAIMKLYAMKEIQRVMNS